MSETYKYLEELSRILKVDQENKESIIKNSIDGIKGEEDSLFCNKKGSFLVEEFISMYGIEELNELLTNIGEDKYFIIIDDSIGSRVIESIYKRFEMIIGQAKEKEQEESIRIITQPIYDIIYKKEKEINQMEEDKKEKTIEELIQNKYSAHVISEMIKLISKYQQHNQVSEIIKIVSEKLINEESHEIEIESIPLICELIKIESSGIGRKLINIINNGNIPITDENWSILTENCIEVMDDVNLRIFNGKYITKEVIIDKIGNHVVQTYLKKSEDVNELIENIVVIIREIIEKKYFMMIVNLLQNMKKIKNKKKEDEIIKRIKNEICGRGNIFEEGRKEWMKGKKEFIDYGFCMILEELYGRIKKDMKNEFFMLKEKRMEDYINHKEGSHVIESIVMKNEESENEELIERLRGRIWSMSMNKNASFVVEKLFMKSGMKGKEKIIEEMNSNYEEIEKNFIGRKVIEKMRINEYREDVNKWKRLMNLKKNMMAAFTK